MLFNCGENVYIKSVYVNDSNIKVETIEEEYIVNYRNIFDESLERCLFEKFGCFYSNRENISKILKIDTKINNYRDNNKVNLEKYNDGYGIRLDGNIVILTKDDYESDSIYYDTVEKEFVEDTLDKDIINSNNGLVNIKNRIINLLYNKVIYNNSIYNILDKNRIVNYIFYIIIFFIIIFGLYIILYLYMII